MSDQKKENADEAVHRVRNLDGSLDLIGHRVTPPQGGIAGPMPAVTSRQNAREKRLEEFNPVKSTELNTWRDYEMAILRQHATTVKSHMELARLCYEADKCLAIDDALRVRNNAPFSNTKFSMYVGIGSDKRLFERRVLILLPPCYSIIYQVHLLTDEELEHAIEQGILCTGCRREQIEALRLKRTYAQLANQRIERAASVPDDDMFFDHDWKGMQSSEDPFAVEWVVLGELKVPRAFRYLEGLHSELLKLVAKYEVEFVARPGPELRRIHRVEETDLAIHERREALAAQEKSKATGPSTAPK